MGFLAVEGLGPVLGEDCVLRDSWPGVVRAATSTSRSLSPGAGGCPGSRGIGFASPELAEFGFCAGSIMPLLGGDGEDDIDSR